MVVLHSANSSPPRSLPTPDADTSGATADSVIRHTSKPTPSPPQVNLTPPKDPHSGHRRVPSNPFDVLYDADAKRASSPLDPRHSPYFTDGQNSPLLEPGLFVPKHQRIISDVPPIITLIDSQAITRTSSVISRSASLRNRHNITKRNRMVKKKDLEFDSDSIYNSDRKSKTPPSSIRQRIRFLFPVRRKTSLHKTPAYKLLKESRNKGSLHTRKDLEDLLVESNAMNLVKEMLPKQMKVYSYSRLAQIVPKLAGQMNQFDISDDNVFTMVPPNVTRLQISAPVKETFTKNGYNEYEHRLHKNKFNLLDSIYNRYRAEVFSNKYNVPPKFNDVFPDESGRNLLTAKEIDSLNKKILLEVLLRRTLAAKIEYRLKKNGWGRKKVRRKSKQSSSSSNSSSDGGPHYRHSHVPRLVHTDSDSGSENDSVDTDDIMQHNASLYSGLLPSPQISYKSNIFGSGLDFNTSDFDASSEPHKIIASERVLSEAATTVVRRSTPDSQFVNEFSRALYQHQQDTHREVQPALRTGLDYDLQPINRSTDTFSSTDSEPLSRTPLSNLSKNNSMKSNYKRASRETRGTSFSSPERKSISSNVSILQDLNDLSSQLSNYINDKEPRSEQRFVHKNILPSESALIQPETSEPASTSNIVHSIQMSNEPLVISSPNKSVTKDLPPVEIQSMKGSLVGSLKSAASSRFKKHEHAKSDTSSAHSMGFVSINKLSTNGQRSLDPTLE